MANPFPGLPLEANLLLLEHTLSASYNAFLNLILTHRHLYNIFTARKTHFQKAIVRHFFNADFPPAATLHYVDDKRKTAYYYKTKTADETVLGYVRAVLARVEAWEFGWEGLKEVYAVHEQMCWLAEKLEVATSVLYTRFICAGRLDREPSDELGGKVYLALYAGQPGVQYDPEEQENCSKIMNNLFRTSPHITNACAQYLMINRMHYSNLLNFRLEFRRSATWTAVLWIMRHNRREKLGGRYDSRECHDACEREMKRFGSALLGMELKAVDER